MKRSPGRPPLDRTGQPSAPVSLKLTASDYDRIDRIARQQRTTMSDVIRKGLKHLLHDQRGGPL
jgi:Arc/MetJ-type ribon-helix-helix transcriptional regulator